MRSTAVIGLARLPLRTRREIDAMLSRIQNDLFDLGADLCTPEQGKAPKYPPLRIVDAQMDRLEHEIDAMNAELSAAQSLHPARRHTGRRISASRPHGLAPGGAADDRTGCA